MPHYVLVRLHAADVDHEELVAYRAANGPLVARHGGRFLVRGGGAEVLEGSAVDRVVLIEFPDAVAARAWWEDPEYAAIRPLRQAHSRADIVLAEGVG